MSKRVIAQAGEISFLSTDDEITLGANDKETLRIAEDGVEISGLQAGDPTANDPIDSSIEIYSLDGNAYGVLGFVAGDLVLTSMSWGAPVFVNTTDGTGTLVQSIEATADYTAISNANGQIIIFNDTGSIELLAAEDSADPAASAPITNQILFSDGGSNFTHGFVGYNTSGIFTIRNTNRSSGLTFRADNASGVDHPLIIADPDAAITLYHNNTAVARTASVGSGSFEVYNGSIFEAVLTTSSLATALTTPLDVYADIPTATPPTSEAVTAQIRFRDSDDTDTLAIYGFSGDNILAITNTMRDGAVELYLTDGSGNVLGVLSGNPGDATGLAFNGDYTFWTHPQGIEVWGETAGSPAATDPIDTRLFLSNTTGTGFGELGYDNSAVLKLYNYAYGAGIILTGNDAGGTEITYLTSDDNSTAIFHSGAVRISTSTNGFELWGMDAGDPTVPDPISSLIGFYDENGDGPWGYVGYNAAANFTIENTAYTGTVRLIGTDSVGTPTTLAIFDPEGSVDLYHNGTLVAQTAASGSGAFLVDKGSGLEEVAVLSEVSAIEDTVQTTNATPATLLTYAIASNVSVGFEVLVIGREDATGDTVLEKIFGLISNEAGTTALIGSTIVDRNDSAGASAWVIAVTANDGTDELTVTVTGEAAHTIDWRARLTVIDV